MKTGTSTTTCSRPDVLMNGSEEQDGEGRRSVSSTRTMTPFTQISQLAVLALYSTSRSMRRNSEGLAAAVLVPDAVGIQKQIRVTVEATGRRWRRSSSGPG